MKSAKWILPVGLAFLFMATPAAASGPVGIYGIIERVIFEPNENAPERIQVWGSFAFVENGLARPGATSRARAGYLYFKLPDAKLRGEKQLAIVKTEWADLKSVAGTGQAIGFGNWGLVGAFNLLDSSSGGSNAFPFLMELFPGGGSQTDVRVRPASEAPANPAVYSTNAGLVKLTNQGSHAEISRQRREALRTR